MQENLDRAHDILAKLAAAVDAASARIKSATHPVAQDAAIKSLSRAALSYAVLLDAVTRYRKKGHKITVQHQYVALAPRGRKVILIDGKPGGGKNQSITCEFSAKVPGAEQAHFEALRESGE